MQRARVRRAARRWRAASASRSACTAARPAARPSRCSPSTPAACASSCTASRRRSTSSSATSAATSSRFAGNLTYKNSDDLRSAAASRARRPACWSRPTRPFLAPMPHRGHTNRPAYVALTAQFLAPAARLDRRRGRRGHERQRPACVRPRRSGRAGRAGRAAALVSAAHARPPARRRYGQHHLVDQGTLEAILAMAGVTPDDVVLEVGAGDGLLTARLAEQARFVHAFEIDRRFGAALGELCGRTRRPAPVRGRRRCATGSTDARPAADGRRGQPRLQHRRAAASCARSPSCRACGAGPSCSSASSPSGSSRRRAPRPTRPCRCWCSSPATLEAQRPVPRTVFAPPPRVDSAFVTFTRSRRGPADRCRRCSTRSCARRSASAASRS